MSTLNLIEPLDGLSGRLPDLMADDLPDFNPGKVLSGDNVRRARKAKNMTKHALAQACGVSDRAVYNWEHDIYVPEGAALTKLLKVLELELPEGYVGRGRVVKDTTGPIMADDRAELEMIRQHVRMIDAMLGRILGPPKS